MDTFIEKSEQVDKLALALCKAQSVLMPAKKDSSNPHFKSTYASLASVTEAVQKTLTENGLSVLQFGRVREGASELFTMLLHTSGQWIGGAFPLITTKSDPQSLKSAITYMRRAGIESITGLATEDDDANAASQQPTYRSNATIAQTFDMNRPMGLSGTPSLEEIAMSKGAKTISEAQLKRLWAIARDAGWFNEDVLNYVRVIAQVDDPAKMSWTFYDRVWKFIQNNPPPELSERG